MGVGTGPGVDIDSYQAALVIILLLNLFFWLIVIVWRFCYLRKLNAIVERRREEMRNRHEAVENEQRNPEDEIYALSRGDFPPSYNDAIKSRPVFILESAAPSPASGAVEGSYRISMPVTSGDQCSFELREVSSDGTTLETTTLNLPEPTAPSTNETLSDGNSAGTSRKKDEPKSNSGEPTSSSGQSSSSFSP